MLRPFFLSRTQRLKSGSLAPESERCLVALTVFKTAVPGANPGGMFDSYPLRHFTNGDRVLDDFVNLMDLAPTFLEVGGARVADAMTGRSLVKVPKSAEQGACRSTPCVGDHWAGRACCQSTGGKTPISTAGLPESRRSLHHQFQTRSLADGEPVQH